MTAEEGACTIVWMIVAYLVAATVCLMVHGELRGSCRPLTAVRRPQGIVPQLRGWSIFFTCYACGVQNSDHEESSMSKLQLHPKTERMLARVGTDIRTWRVAQRLTAKDVAERAGITRATLRTIETNPGSVSLHNIMAVLAVLGADETVAGSFNPAMSDRGQAILTSAATGEV